MSPTTRSKDRNVASGGIPVRKETKATPKRTMPRSKKSKEPDLKVAVDDIRGFAEPDTPTMPDPAGSFAVGHNVRISGLQGVVHADRNHDGKVPVLHSKTAISTIAPEYLRPMGSTESKFDSSAKCEFKSGDKVEIRGQPGEVVIETDRKVVVNIDGLNAHVESQYLKRQAVGVGAVSKDPAPQELLPLTANNLEKHRSSAGNGYDAYVLEWMEKQPRHTPQPKK